MNDHFDIQIQASTNEYPLGL